MTLEFSNPDMDSRAMRGASVRKAGLKRLAEPRLDARLSRIDLGASVGDPHDDGANDSKSERSKE